MRVNSARPPPTTIGPTLICRRDQFARREPPDREENNNIKMVTGKQGQASFDRAVVRDLFEVDRE